MTLAVPYDLGRDIITWGIEKGAADDRKIGIWDDGDQDHIPGLATHYL